MNIIVGCEESGEVRDAFIKQGHNATSCDLKPARNGGPHYQGSLFDLDYTNVDLAIIHPPCTYLAVTANKWLKDQPPRKSGALVGEARRRAQKEAQEFFMACWNLPVKRLVIENPVGVMSTKWRKPDQIIQPFQFGHCEPKKTCLWLRNLPLLKPTKIVEPEYHITESGKRVPKWFFYADASKGQAHRAEIRSKTFPGIAEAMATQWTDPKTMITTALEIDFNTNHYIPKIA